MGEEFIRRIMVLGEVPSLGPVVLYDDMEDLFKWTESGTGGDSVFEKITTVAYNGAACLHFKTRTTNAAADDTVCASRLTFQRSGKRYRLEMLWNLVVKANCKVVDFKTWIYDGVNVHTVNLRYDPQNNKWQYMNSAGTFTDVTGGAQDLLQNGWHRVMVEYDENSGEYIKMVSDGLEIPLTDVGYKKAASAANVRQSVDLIITAQSTTPPEIYFDDVLVMEI